MFLYVCVPMGGITQNKLNYFMTEVILTKVMTLCTNSQIRFKSYVDRNLKQQSFDSSGFAH